MSNQSIKITNVNLKEEIEKYFAQLYHPKDSENKNKFKVGSCVISENKFEVTIYFKPRNQVNLNSFAEDNKIGQLVTINEGTSCGGFRIRWNVLNNSFVYILPERYKDWRNIKEGNIYLIISHDKWINVDDRYRNIVSKLKKHVNKVINEKNKQNKYHDDVDIKQSTYNPEKSKKIISVEYDVPLHSWVYSSW